MGKNGRRENIYFMTQKLRRRLILLSNRSAAIAKSEEPREVTAPSGIVRGDDESNRDRGQAWGQMQAKEALILHQDQLGLSD
jgi:hypothetical protein